MRSRHEGSAFASRSAASRARRCGALDVLEPARWTLVHATVSSCRSRPLPPGARPRVPRHRPDEGLHPGELALPPDDPVTRLFHPTPPPASAPILWASSQRDQSHHPEALEEGVGRGCPGDLLRRIVGGMTDEPGQLGPSGEVRASDAEREAVVERLRVATVEGRLTLGELTERTEAAYSATTRGDLALITADLPEVPRTPAVPTPP